MEYVGLKLFSPTCFISASSATLKQFLMFRSVNSPAIGASSHRQKHPQASYSSF